MEQPPLVVHAPQVEPDVRPRRTARTTAFQAWLVRTRTRVRRGIALLSPMMQRVRAVRGSLPAIITSRPYRPALSMPLVAFFAGLTLGALVMWMMPTRIDVAASPASTRAEAAREPRNITMAGLGEAPRFAATSGSQPPSPLPATTDTVARAVLPSTVPPLQEAVSRPAPAPAVRRPPQKPAAPRPQAAAPRPVAAGGPQYRGSLSVRSRPEGASVFINGRLVGTTPLVLANEAVGSRAVRVTLNGYEAWTAAPQVVAYKQTTINADLRSALTP